MSHETADMEPIAIMRAVVQRANGTREVYYSHEKVSIWDFRRWWKLQKHLRMMRQEDKRNGPHY